MTTISPVSASTVRSSTSAVAAGARTQPKVRFGQDTFLELLDAQMTYHDRMNLMNSSQFLAQTAQFTSVEKLNDISIAIKAQSAATEVLEASAMIGKDVSVATSGTPT